MNKNIRKLNDLSSYLRFMARSGVNTYDIEAFPEFFESMALMLETIASEISFDNSKGKKEWMLLQ